MTKSGIHQFQGGVLTSAQALWGEILSGQRFWETGCVGYAFPKTSLNDLEIGSQSTYQFRSVFTDNFVNFAINVPLIEPSNGKRIWLSDGSFSSESVAPRELLANEPFKSYRARPFSSPAYYLRRTLEGVEACLQAEKQRLLCAIELATGNNWQVGVVRLSIFDQLFHLLGKDFLLDETLTIHPSVKSFLEFANTGIQKILASATNATTCIMSAYSHAECTRRANLNLLLSQLGYCALTEPKQAKLALELRHRSTLALSGERESSISPTPLVTLTNHFQKSSIAVSPVHGAIYLNRKGRFQEGIVEDHEIKGLKKQVASDLTKLLNNSGIQNMRLELNPQDRPNSQAPDLMLCADGLDFHNAYGSPSIDHINHPLTCHTSNGFVGLKNHPQQIFDTLSLNSLLVGSLK